MIDQRKIGDKSAMVLCPKCGHRVVLTKKDKPRKHNRLLLAPDGGFRLGPCK